MVTLLILLYHNCFLFLILKSLRREKEKSKRGGRFGSPRILFYLNFRCFHNPCTGPIRRNEKYKLIGFLENEVKYLTNFRTMKFYDQLTTSTDAITIFSLIIARIFFVSSNELLALFFILIFSPIIET